MRLKTVRFKNYKQHRDLELDVDANVVAIIGKNGEGKSNAIGGIQFALTGEQPGFTKQELTTWGTKSGSVSLEFKHNGTDFLLERSTSSSEATLDYGTTHIKGISPVNAELLSLVGVDPDIMRQSVFVNQAQIDAVLFALPSERELAFQKLVGIGNAAKIHEALGARISALEKPTDYSTIIATLTSESDSWGKLLGTAQTEGQALRTRLDALGIADPQAEREFLSTLNTTLTDVNKYKEATYKWSLANTALEQVMAEAMMPVSATDTGYDAAKAEYDLAVMEDQSTQILARQLTEYNTVKAQVAQAQTAWEAVSIEAKDLEAIKLRVSELRESIVAKQSLASEYAGELHSLNELNAAASRVDGSCPLCGSKGVSITPEQLARRIELAGHISAVSSDVREFQRQLNLFQSSVDSLTMKLTQATTTLQLATKRLAGYSNAAILENDTLVTQRIKSGTERLSTAKKAYDAAMQAKAGKDAAIRYNAELSTRQRQAKNSYDCAIAACAVFNTPTVLEVVGSGVDLQALINETHQKLRDYDTLNASIQLNDKNLKIYRDKCTDTHNRLAETQEKRVQQQGYLRKLETLNNIRNWFHYKNGPHAVVVDVMKRLTPNVNFFLAKLAAPFAVIADYDTVGFKYQMTNGTVNPLELPTAKSLSGAQKNMLALAFRLACYCMFSAKLGILVLDEPTAHLDNDNVGKFGELLQRLQVMAREMNLQILVVTHHAEILPFCDKTIVIGAKPGEET